MLTAGDTEAFITRWAWEAHVRFTYASQLCSICSPIINLGTARVGDRRAICMIFATFDVNFICKSWVHCDILYILHIYYSDE